MISKAIASLVASGALMAGVLVAAPASANNYAPQLPTSRFAPEESVNLGIDGAQPRCRVTFSIRSVRGSDNVDRGLETRKRVRVDEAGRARAELTMPTTPGRYRLITRVDNFPNQTGCTPSKEVQIIRIR